MTVEQFWHRVPGGTATAVWNLAHALAERGGSRLVGVSALHRDGPPLRFRLPFPVKHLPLPRLALYAAWHRWRVPRVQTATGPVDVIHATTLAIPPKSAPLVVTIHDLAFVDAPEHFTPRGLKLFGSGLRLARSDATLIACPSETTARRCVDLGIESDRIRVVPWGVRVEPVSDETRVRVLKRHSIDGPYILWTGTIEPRKNLARLVEAYLSMDHQLDLVLAGPTGWNEDLSALLARGGDRVRALGYVEPGELTALYSGARAFCYPSLTEGFGLPVLEAMAQGTPVVTARGTATEEVAGGAAILVDPLEVASIAAGLTEAVGDETTQARLRAAGRERAAELTWERCAQKMHDVYVEVGRG